ncbi:MAG: FeoB-associated Cys-rich membrane protein [Akkermansia sp.]|nr:FeoB-associated Cys-rich membrane protein [Akkermansia sp.]
MADIIIILVLAAITFLIIRSLLRQRAQGGCGSCGDGGGCGCGCSGCSSRKKEVGKHD